MAALGEQLSARKAELKKMFRQTGIPRPETRSMKGVPLTVGQPV
nr:hypothetical protein [Hyphomonas sp.]